ncbi:ATP-binding protein [Agreia pratensis]|uniref:Regulatory protein, luxR family n=1 Tax=Agreia pratensis TaxID=150121 RepID=A0A1X7IUD9_9MICO|nr:AAA family ATPase [Agreia pratensis]SMG18731.1 regulatory protein, luxR family [Agreia pratensis]
MTQIDVGPHADGRSRPVFEVGSGFGSGESEPALDTPSRRPALIARENEIAAIRNAVKAASRTGSTLLVSGDAGLGKTSLAFAAVEYARWAGLDVLQASGVQAEEDVPYATLHQLLHVLRDRVADLPPPQRQALQSAFGESQESPSIFLASVAVLTLLSERATSAGLLIVIEDIHWVDPATRAVVSFLARRMAAEPILLILTARPSRIADELADSPDVQHISLEPLDEPQARRLLAERRGPMAAAVQERVLTEALGNPLALIELSSVADRIGEISAASTPLTKRLESAFAHRLLDLSSIERSVVLVAAVTAEHRQSEILAATSRLVGEDVDAQTIDSLILLDLLHRSRGEVTFRHPLVRSAVVQTATPAERARAHRAVASLLPVGTDRQLWHLAVVADLPDEKLADALEQSAARVHEAGDAVTAMTAFRRAAELSPHLEDRARRNYRSAAIAIRLQQLTEAQQLIDEIGHQTTDPGLLARVAWLRQSIPGSELQTGQFDATIRIADELHRAGRTEHAVTVLMTVGRQIWPTVAEGPFWRSMLEHTLGYGLDVLDPRVLWMKAHGSPGTASQEVRQALESIDPDSGFTVHQLNMLADASTMVGDVQRVDSFMRPTIEGLRREGQLPLLSMALLTDSAVQSLTGRFRLMRSTADEAQRLADEAQQPFLGIAGYLHGQIARATLGEPLAIERLRELYPASAAVLDRNPYRQMMMLTQGISDAGEGRHLDAYVRLRPLVDQNEPGFQWAWGLLFAFPHYVDAAARSGHHAEARERVAEVEARTGLAESENLRSQLAVARALLGAGDGDVSADSDAAFRIAIDATSNVLPYWRARSMLAYGERLRRQRRITEAREQLRQARAEFDRMHVVRWATVARNELEAAGEHSPRRPVDPGSLLTPQEERVASQAAEGLTNKEIAERLFLSPRTVATHLHAVFRKLEITSRSELKNIND